MAIFVEGHQCRICGRPILYGQQTTSFRPFVSNQNENISLFSDGVFHLECFCHHPLAERVLKRLQEIEENNNRWPPVCFICHKQIESPNEHFTFGHLTNEHKSYLFDLNYKHAHRLCLKTWDGLYDTVKAIEQLEISGLWKGLTLRKIIEQMNNL